ncbi:Ada metal-binding domain-containing protein [Mucilaginibacter ximonensis]|uniref:Ada metal-binding domain-containing protein n=1 Tax=Mucilaginibacter ximonensis TaxID=538021 RepID=A0ABW5YEP5_9SPHI
MINHIDLGPSVFSRFMAIQKLIQKGEICYGGNKKLKIYGTLQCKSGKRMKSANRVFFIDEQEAIDAGYRPCGHCMIHQYQTWKQQNGNQ